MRAFKAFRQFSVNRKARLDQADRVELLEKYHKSHDQNITHQVYLYHRKKLFVSLIVGFSGLFYYNLFDLADEGWVLKEKYELKLAQKTALFFVDELGQSSNDEALHLAQEISNRFNQRHGIALEPIVLDTDKLIIKILPTMVLLISKATLRCLNNEQIDSLLSYEYWHLLQRSNANNLAPSALRRLVIPKIFGFSENTRIWTQQLSQLSKFYFFQQYTDEQIIGAMSYVNGLGLDSRFLEQILGKFRTLDQYSIQFQNQQYPIKSPSP